MSQYSFHTCVAHKWYWKESLTVICSAIFQLANGTCMLYTFKHYPSFISLRNILNRLKCMVIIKKGNMPIHMYILIKV